MQIQIPSISENIRIVESFIDNIKEKYHLDDDIYGNIMIAVTESVNNAILHGNKNDRKKDVSLKLLLEGSQLIFVISDQGNGFDQSLRLMRGGFAAPIPSLVDDQANVRPNNRRCVSVSYVPIALSIRW